VEAPPPSHHAVLQQQLQVLVAGGGRGLLGAAREGRVYVHAGQRGHGLLAVQLGLVHRRQLGGGVGGEEEEGEGFSGMKRATTKAKTTQHAPNRKGGPGMRPR